MQATQFITQSTAGHIHMLFDWVGWSAHSPLRPCTVRRDGLWLSALGYEWEQAWLHDVNITHIWPDNLSWQLFWTVWETFGTFAVICVIIQGLIFDIICNKSSDIDIINTKLILSSAFDFKFLVKNPSPWVPYLGCKVVQKVGLVPQVGWLLVQLPSLWVCRSSHSHLVNCCPSLYVSPVIIWQPVQVVPQLLPTACWDRLQPPVAHVWGRFSIPKCPLPFPLPTDWKRDFFLQGTNVHFLQSSH